MSDKPDAQPTPKKSGAIDVMREHVMEDQESFLFAMTLFLAKQVLVEIDAKDAELAAAKVEYEQMNDAAINLQAQLAGVVEQCAKVCDSESKRVGLDIPRAALAKAARLIRALSPVASQQDAQADAATEIKTMVDEAASAIVKDAERYRWLRDGRGCEEIWGADLALEKLDAAIDDARAGKREGEG